MKTSMIVQIYSFGYHLSGIPRDSSGHGGGFVFDCRHLPNPGKEAQYQLLTGQDPAVQAYLQAHSIVEAFLQDVFRMVDRTIKVYTERNFKDLMVAFGCTGGQHRSIYCAEQLNQHLREQGIHTVLHHTELTEIKLRIKLAQATPIAQSTVENAGVTTGEIIFCDLKCPYAEFPEKEAIDGARSCRTFSALWCRKLKQYVAKNAPCAYRFGSRRPKAGW